MTGAKAPCMALRACEINKNLSVNYNDIINNKWLTDNMNIIKKMFDIRGKKYSDNFKYYNILQLLITILKNLFDEKLFIYKRIKIFQIDYLYYTFNKDLYDEHLQIINYIDANFIDDILEVNKNDRRDFAVNYKDNINSYRKFPPGCSSNNKQENNIGSPLFDSTNV